MERASGRTDGLRQLAEAQLRRRQDLAIHVAAYLSVNALLVAIWSFAGGGEFWPIVPIVVWGLALALHGWSVHGRGAGMADPVAREMERLRAKQT